LTVCLGLLTALAAQANSLGPMTMKSALGEPLRAEVDLIDLTGAEAVRSILAIAAPATYRDLGLPFPPGLEGANVTLVRRLDGTYGALVTTSRPISGAEVNVVLTLTTTSGQQLRNYRVGARPDPASAASAVPSSDAARASAPSVGPSGATAASGAFTPSGADAAQPPLTVTTEAPRSDPAAAPGAASAAASAPAAATTPAAASAAAPAAAIAAPAPTRPVVPLTVTVVRGETATSIARRIKPGDVDDAQAVMALYRNNQRAFSGNVHSLPEGAVLILPDPDQMRAVRPEQARRALRAQRPDPSRALVTVPAGDRLQLSEGGRGGSKELNGAGTAAARQRSIAFEAAMSEAQSRIAQLQANVAGLTKLIEAKNLQMAQLEAQLRASGAAAAQQAAAGAPGAIIPVGAATATMVDAPTRATPAAPLIAPEPEESGMMPGIEVIVAVVFVVLLIGLLVFWVVRRRRMAREAEDDIEWPTWAPSQN